MPQLRTSGAVGGGMPYTAEDQLNDYIYGGSDVEPPVDAGVPLGKPMYAEATQASYAPQAPIGLGAGASPEQQFAAAPATAPTPAPSTAPAAQPMAVGTPQVAPATNPAQEFYAPPESIGMGASAPAQSSFAQPAPATQPGPVPLGDPAFAPDLNLTRQRNLNTLGAQAQLRQTALPADQQQLATPATSPAMPAFQRTATAQRGGFDPQAISPARPGELPVSFRELMAEPAGTPPGTYRGAAEFATPAPATDPYLADAQRAQQRRADQERIAQTVNEPAAGDTRFFDALGGTARTMADNLTRSLPDTHRAGMFPEVDLDQFSNPLPGVADTVDWWQDTPVGSAVTNLPGAAADYVAETADWWRETPVGKTVTAPFGPSPEPSTPHPVRGWGEDWQSLPETAAAQPSAGLGAQEPTGPAPAAPPTPPDTPFYILSDDGAGGLAYQAADRAAVAGMTAGRGMETFRGLDLTTKAIEDYATTPDIVAALDASGNRLAQLNDAEFDSLVTAGLITPAVAEAWRPLLVNTAFMVPPEWAQYISEPTGETPVGTTAATDVSAGVAPTGEVIFTPVAGTGTTVSGGEAAYGGGSGGGGYSSGGGGRRSSGGEYGGGYEGGYGGGAPSTMLPGFMDGFMEDFRWNGMMPDDSPWSGSSRREDGLRSGRSMRRRSRRSRGGSRSTPSAPNTGRNEAERRNLDRLNQMRER